jgi:hypothetical protein
MHKTNKIEFPSELFGPWKNFDGSKLRYPQNFKYRNRDYILKIIWRNCCELVPDYLRKQDSKVIDISAANGASLEIFRYFGYDVMAVDYYREKNGYELFLESQEIPYINHDCSTFPYPIPNKSYDLLLNFGAITQYSNDVTIWPNVLNEFARIAKQTIALIVNYGWKLKAGREYIQKWNHPQFKLTKSNNNNCFRWDAQ